jgi:hypothetical protein
VSGIPAGDELTDLVFFALDHGIESVREGGPLVGNAAFLGEGEPLF